MNSIGTLSEKSVHSYIKDYISKEGQETKVGNYIADIKLDNTIYEIQTAQYKNLVNKLNYYIEHNFDIVVIMPIIQHKVIYWLDPDTDCIESTSKSSHTGVIQDHFKDLYWIQDYIAKNQIKLWLFLIDVCDYRYLDGYGTNCKKRATKIDKVPTKINNIIKINSVSDMKIFIPSTLDKEFDSIQFKKHSHSNSKYTGSGLKILRELGVISIVRKEANKFIYTITSE